MNQKNLHTNLYNLRLEKFVNGSFGKALNLMKEDENYKIKMLNFKRKLRSVIGDFMFQRFELPEPYLFRLGKYFS